MSHHSYDEELRDEFERTLNYLALNGKHLPVANPFDWRVIGALKGIARAYPSATIKQIFLELQIHRWPAHRKWAAGS